PYGWCTAHIAAAVGDDRLAPRPTIIRVGDDDWLGLWTWIGVVPNVKAVMKRSGCSVDSHERLFGPNGRGLDHTGIPPVLTLVSGLSRHHLGAEACSRGSERRVTLVELTSIVVYRPRPEAVGVWWGHHRRQERYRPGCARVLANEPGYVAKAGVIRAGKKRAGSSRISNNCRGRVIRSVRRAHLHVRADSASPCGCPGARGARRCD